ncbi:MAG: CoA-transferase [Pseudomonadota bacterium]
MEANINPFEMMIGALSRLLNDGEMAACGTLSPIPASAILLAKHTHAPNLTPFIYGDLSLRLTEGHLETFAAFQRGKVDVFFLSGVQIGQNGHVNLSVIGDYRKPKVRFPGGAGSNMVYSCAKRALLFAPVHTKRVLVKEVDFKNALAFDEGKPTPWRRGHPSHLVTPLCVMKYDKDNRILVLESLMPGVTLDQVIENTGFDLGIDGREIPHCDPISQEELKILRALVSQEVKKIYPDFAKQMWG